MARVTLLFLGKTFTCNAHGTSLHAGFETSTEDLNAGKGAPCDGLASHPGGEGSRNTRVRIKVMVVLTS